MVWKLELCIEVEKSLYGSRLCRLVEKLRTRNQLPATRNQISHRVLGYLVVGKLGVIINGLKVFNTCYLELATRNQEQETKIHSPVKFGLRFSLKAATPSL